MIHIHFGRLAVRLRPVWKHAGVMGKKGRCLSGHLSRDALMFVNMVEYLLWSFPSSAIATCYAFCVGCGVHLPCAMSFCFSVLLLHDRTRGMLVSMVSYMRVGIYTHRHFDDVKASVISIELQRSYPMHRLLPEWRNHMYSMYSHIG